MKSEYVEYVTARLQVLRRVAYVLCGNEHEADDLVQLTITKLYVRWRRLREVEHLDHVRAMLVRTFLDERRRPWSRVALADRLPDRPVVSDDRTEEFLVLRAALSRVPRRQQAVLVLRFLCDLSIEEVAMTLGCSEGTVKRHT